MVIKRSKVLAAFSSISLMTLILVGCTTHNDQAKVKREVGEPEAAVGFEQKQAVLSDEYMVVAANPYASWAGQQVIERGGSAIDAAIAVQAMLTLVEPQSSGIGGGAFILYWDNKSKTLHSFDARETAPQNIHENWFMDNGQPMKWIEAVIGGKSVGVPGVLRGLEQAHNEFGVLPWQQLFADTIRQAKQGFTVSERLNKLLDLKYNKGLLEFPKSAAYFYPDNQPLKTGTIKRNPELANSLENIAKKGADYFYKGELAKQIAETVQTSSILPGTLSQNDLVNYGSVKREVLCGPYRSYKLCGMAPPSSGGVTVYQLLSMLEQFPISDYTNNSVEFAHLYCQASARAYADRNQYIADSDFIQLDYKALVDDAYLSQRSSDISLSADWQKVSAGNPFINASISAGQSFEAPNTSHLVIVDKQGNAVSMTTSIEFMFGSGLMVGGFLLNNQLTDFSFSPVINGQKVLNRVEPGKRPRSAMSPTMVFNKEGDLTLVVGSPGGSRIVSYVAQTIIGVIDWNLDIQQSINLPKITNRNDYTTLEKGTELEALKTPLESMGHSIRIGDLNSGLHGIQIKDGMLIGGADPRREGRALGNSL